MTASARRSTRHADRREAARGSGGLAVLHGRSHAGRHRAPARHHAPADQPHPRRRPPQRPRRHHPQLRARELCGARAAADPRLQAEGRGRRPDARRRGAGAGDPRPRDGELRLALPRKPPDPRLRHRLGPHAARDEPARARRPLSGTVRELDDGRTDARPRDQHVRHRQRARAEAQLAVPVSRRADLRGQSRSRATRSSRRTFSATRSGASRPTSSPCFRSAT